MPVTGEHRPAREGHPGAERHTHVVDESDDRRHGDASPLRTELVAMARHDHGLVLEHEHDGSTDRHDTERLEAGIEEQCSSCLLYTSPSPRDGLLSRMPSS